MKTIEQVIDDHIPTGATPSVETIAELRDDLRHREQEAIDRLQVLAQRFGLLPQIVAKVLQEIELGDPPTDDQRDYVNAQYAEFLRQAEAQREEAIERYRALGVPVNAPPFVDPLSEEAPADIVIPDTPEG